MAASGGGAGWARGDGDGDHAAEYAAEDGTLRRPRSGGGKGVCPSGVAGGAGGEAREAKAREHSVRDEQAAREAKFQAEQAAKREVEGALGRLQRLRRRRRRRARRARGECLLARQEGQGGGRGARAKASKRNKQAAVISLKPKAPVERASPPPCATAEASPLCRPGVLEGVGGEARALPWQQGRREEEPSRPRRRRRRWSKVRREEAGRRRRRRPRRRSRSRRRRRIRPRQEEEPSAGDSFARLALCYLVHVRRPRTTTISAILKGTRSAPAARASARTPRRRYIEIRRRSVGAFVGDKMRPGVSMSSRLGSVLDATVLPSSKRARALSRRPSSPPSAGPRIHRPALFLLFVKQRGSSASAASMHLGIMRWTPLPPVDHVVELDVPHQRPR